MPDPVNKPLKVFDTAPLIRASAAQSQLSLCCKPMGRRPAYSRQCSLQYKTFQDKNTRKIQLAMQSAM